MKGTLLSVQIAGLRTLKDGSVSVTMETPELSPGNAAEIFALRNKVAFVYVSERQIEANEKKVVDSLEPESTGKTPAQRLRNVLYRMWEQNKEGYPDSDSHYRAKMENIIGHYKTELNP